MASGATLRVRGLREVQLALNKVNRGAAKTVRDELKRAAEPVAADARERLSRYEGASTNTISPRATGGNVFVTQRARKVTGQRPDFGRLQMVLLEESLEAHEGEIVDRVEDALDRLSSSAGF